MRYTAAERAALIDRYEKGPQLLRTAFAAVPREAWNWKPDVRQWSVHEILSHCADAEANAAMRIRFILAEDKPVIVGFDQDRWAKALDYNGARVELALAAVDVMRAITINLLRRLSDDAWSKEGTHTERGRYTAEDWLQTYAEHLEKHAGQIDRTLEAWRQEDTHPGVVLAL